MPFPIRPAATNNIASSSALVRDAQAMAQVMLSKSNVASGKIDYLADRLNELSVINQPLASQVRKQMDSALSPVERGQLDQLISAKTPLSTSAAKVDTTKLALDLTQIALDIVGIFEPTPFADGANTVISLFRGEWGQAGLSALGTFPYIGDLAKLGKLGKWAKTVSNAIDTALANPAARKALEPGLRKVADALNNIPQSALKKLPQSAQDQIAAMESKVNGFFAKSKVNGADNLASLVAKRREIARDFYLKQGFAPSRIDGHLAGIDFSKPVEVITLKKGTKVTQFQAPGGSQGNYYALPGTPASKLGINPNAEVGGVVRPRTEKTYIVNQDVQVLRSTAAKITDTWSVTNKPFVADGGAIQYFTTSASLFRAK